MSDAPRPIYTESDKRTSLEDLASHVQNDAVVAVGEPLTYHTERTDADHLVSQFFQRVAQALPPDGLLIFDVIGLGEPSLAGRNWMSGDDWAVLVETTEDQTERTLVRNIETFRRVGELYRRSHEVHTVGLFDVAALCDRLASYGFATETAQSYGTQQLPPRRHTVFATRLGERGGSERRANPKHDHESLVQGLAESY